MIQEIKLDNSPNQTMKVELNIDGGTKVLQLILRYNMMANYWVMTILDSLGVMVLDSIPLLTGLNILKPYKYLKIGSAALLKVGSTVKDYPDDTDLGSDFILGWGDTPI